MATDDPDIQPFLNVNQTENDKENDRPSSNASQNDTSQVIQHKYNTLLNIYRPINYKIMQWMMKMMTKMEVKKYRN